ncbi:MAG: 1-acyl-sn-glycerol-3-phosphate acyltransferase [Hydrogenimonas sp.]|nr:1-acyl-sn-glycerol-3-phosphate acyltransferase [Hydrogenimonas sp.]
MKIFARIRFYYSAFVIALIVSIMIPFLKLFPKKKWAILHYGNRAMMALMFAKIERVGEPDPNAKLYLLNHQGIVDIITMEALLPINLNWVAKRELFEVPWFGKLLKNAEMIAVDRSDKRGLIKLLKDVKHSIEELKRPVALFPEGTRAKDQKLLPFKEGARFIAQKLNLIVQPVVIVGSKRVVNEHDQTSIGGSVRVIFLPSIDTSKASENCYEGLRETMQKRIDLELSESETRR